jgi:hypothetical protein
MKITFEITIDPLFQSIPFCAFSYIRRLFHDTNYMHTLYLLHDNEYSKHCATNRQVASSIPDGVTGIFQ